MALNTESSLDRSGYIDGVFHPRSLTGLEIQLYRLDKAGKHKDGGRVLQQILDLLGVHARQSGNVQ